MRFSFASAARGSCAASSDDAVAVVAEGLRSFASAACVLTSVRDYREASPEVTGRLLTSSALRRICARRDCAMTRVGLLHAEASGRVSLDVIGDLILWERSGRLARQAFPEPGSPTSGDVIGLAGSQARTCALEVVAGQRLVVGTRGLRALDGLEIYQILASPRGPQAAADALLETLRQQGEDAAVAVLFVDQG